MVAQINQAPLLVILGETASGKSALALMLAQKLNGEIICADSWTVRKYMDIGTAKPTKSEQLVVAHHLIDLVKPDENFTAVTFKQLAMQKIRDVSDRGKLPILVGGTGLYIDSVIYDFSFSPIGEISGRSNLESLSIPDLLSLIEDRRLSLENIDIRNKRRLIRLLLTNGNKPTRKPLRQNTLILGIKLNSDNLKQAVQYRVDKMIEAGIEQEVKLLSEQYGWKIEGMKGVGYAQWEKYFLGSQTIEETRLKIVKATLDLAKKQRTWFKRNKSIHWLKYPVDQAEVVDFVTTLLYK